MRAGPIASLARAGEDEGAKARKCEAAAPRRDPGAQGRRRRGERSALTPALSRGERKQASASAIVGSAVFARCRKSAVSGQAPDISRQKSTVSQQGACGDLTTDLRTLTSCLYDWHLQAARRDKRPGETTGHAPAGRVSAVMRWATLRAPQWVGPQLHSSYRIRPSSFNSSCPLLHQTVT